MQKLNPNHRDMAAALIANRSFLFTGSIPEVAAWEKEEQEKFIKQLALEIMETNKFEKTLGNFFDAKEGSRAQRTLWNSIKKACNYGLHVGTHCYLLPGWNNSGECICDLTRYGYIKLMVGPGKVFKAVRHAEVHENDEDCTVDEAGGTFNVKVCMKGPRGKLCGVIMQGIFNSGIEDVKYMDREKLDKRAKMSSGFVDKKWPDEMDINRAYKWYMKQYMMSYGTPEAIEAFLSYDDAGGDSEAQPEYYGQTDTPESTEEPKQEEMEVEEPKNKAKF